MPARVDISVAITTRNRPEALQRLLEAVAGLRPHPAEIVVVDQSTDDRTRHVVDERRNTAFDVRYVRDWRTGLGAGQNLAFSLARCPVVAVTDDDCVPTQRWLPTIAERLASGGDLDVLTGPVLPLDDPDRELVPVSSRTSSAPRSFAGKQVPWEVGSGNNFAVRREWLDAVAGNDERLGPGAPGRGGVDMDLFYRLLRAGARIQYDPRCVVFHARTTRRERLGRRVPYGFGTGAGIGIWLRERDAFAAWVLARWLALRARRAVRGVVTRDWLLAREEALVLGGTARGLWFGLRQDAGRLSSYGSEPESS